MIGRDRAPAFRRPQPQSRTTRWYLIELAHAISRDRSVVTVATIIREAHWSAERAENLRASVRDYLHERDVPAFIRVLPGDHPLRSAQDLIRAYGFGPLVPNTVLLGETEFEVIRASSADADLVVLGLRPPETTETVEAYSAYYRRLLAETDLLPATFLTMAMEKLDFRRIFERESP